MDNSKFCFGLILILCLNFENVLARDANFTYVNSTFNPNVFSSFTAWAAGGSLNVEMTTTKVLDYGLRGQTGIQIRMDNSQKYQTLFSYDFDLCKFLGEIFRDNLISSWFRLALKFGNIMENCPMPASHYYVRNYRLGSSTIPVFLRPGDYRITSLTYYGKRHSKTFDMVCRLKLDLKIY